MPEIKIKSLTDSQLWSIVLIPTDDRMPQKTKNYILSATKEFHSRKLKLIPICK